MSNDNQTRQIESFAISFSPLVKFDIALGSDTGRVRKNQEDAIGWHVAQDRDILADKGAIFVLADGMGGHAAGEIASQVAVAAVKTAYLRDASLDPATALQHALNAASRKVYQANRQKAPGLARMGTTTTAAVLRGHDLSIAHVGDSRAYLVHEKEIRQLTRDHTWVQEQIRLGRLSPAQARSHPRRNIITRSLGQRQTVEADLYSLAHLVAGDVLLICSDGLTNYVTDREICHAVVDLDPRDAVLKLFDLANQRGGGDNMSLIVIKRQDSPATALRTWVQSLIEGGLQ